MCLSRPTATDLTPAIGCRGYSASAAARRIGAALALACGTAAWGAGESYTIDPTHSVPTFEFKHLGLTTQSGRFDRVKGKIWLDRERRTGRVEYEIDTASLNMGVGTETPDSPGFLLFDVLHHPHIRFRAANLRFNASGGVAAAEGELTLLGVTRPQSVQVDRFGCGLSPVNGRMACSGNVSADLRRSQFGMLKYIPAISDEIHISVPVEAYLDPAP